MSRFRATSVNTGPDWGAQATGHAMANDRSAAPGAALAAAAQANRPRPSAQSMEAPASSQLALGILVVATELFVQQSRFFDIYFSGLRIPLVVFILLLGVTMFCLGSQRWNVSNRTTALLVLGMAWLCSTTLFSTWRANSMEELIKYLYLVIVSLAIAIVVDTPARFRRMFTMFGFFYAVAAILGIFAFNPEEPRLQLWRGSYSDPNLYGLCMLMGIPVMWWLMQTSNFLIRLTALVLSVVMYGAVLRTGSRGALVSLVLMILCALFYAPPLRKVIMVVGLMLGITLMVAFLPTYAKKRLLTLFSVDVSEGEAQTMSGKERQLLQGGVGSSESRWQLLVDSFEITVRHPFMGVGAGNFGEARRKMNREVIGGNVAAETTHNTYTQFSSEGGLLALGIFLWQLFEAFRNVRVIRQWNSGDGYRPPPILSSAAHYLHFVLIALCAGMVFLSLAYSGPFLILLGLTVALKNTVYKEWGRYTAAMKAMQVDYVVPTMRQPALWMGKHTGPSVGMD